VAAYAGGGQVNVAELVVGLLSCLEKVDPQILANLEEFNG